jgi:hypothetical protein
MNYSKFKTELFISRTRLVQHPREDACSLRLLSCGQGMCARVNGFYIPPSLLHRMPAILCTCCCCCCTGGPLDTRLVGMSRPDMCGHQPCYTLPFFLLLLLLLLLLLFEGGPPRRHHKLCSQLPLHMCQHRPCDQPRASSGSGAQPNDGRAVLSCQGARRFPE